MESTSCEDQKGLLSTKLNWSFKACFRKAFKGFLLKLEDSFEIISISTSLNTIYRKKNLIDEVIPLGNENNPLKSSN